MADSRRVSLLGTLLAAVTFFTRIPRPSLTSYSPRDDDHAAAFAPWIGAGVGLFTAAIGVASNAAFGAVVAAVLAVFATIWLTGALHEDGLADFCDGFGHAHSRERTLEIMRDPRCGVYGVLGVLGAVLARVACLYVLIFAVPSTVLVTLLIAIAALSRGFAVAPMRAHNYARQGDEGARGARLSQSLSGGWLITCVVGALAPTMLAAVSLSTSILGIIPIMWCAHWLISRAFITRLGGYTGDCLGAAQQVTEVAGLLTLVALAKAGLV